VYFSHRFDGKVQFSRTYTSGSSMLETALSFNREKREVMKVRKGQRKKIKIK
jgi:hypothetical protein